MLSENDEIERRELQRRVFGPGAAGPNECDTARLLELDALALGDQFAVAAATSAEELQAADEDADLPSAATPARGRAPHWGALALAGAVGLIVGLVSAGALYSPVQSPQSSKLIVSDAPPVLPDYPKETWDAGSPTYLGAIPSADVWLATDNNGTKTCIIVAGTAAHMLDGASCLPTDRALASGFVSGSGTIQPRSDGGVSHGVIAADPDSGALMFSITPYDATGTLDELVESVVSTRPDRIPVPAAR